MNALVEVEQLTRRYGEHLAVNEVSFSLKRGEILGFLGPNGAGKSSTMQMICGNLAPTAGAIRIHGIDLLDAPRDAKRCLGYLPDIPPVYRDLTVDEYLRYCSLLHGIQRSEVRGAVDVSKERTGLTEVGNRLIGNLSKGFQQRVGIAQAIVHMPLVVILDEPTVGLDPIQIQEIRTLVRELGNDHGVILSTHILSEVQAVCNHVQIINRGQLVLDASIERLEQSMRASSLLMVLETPSELSAFESIPGIQHIEDLGKGRYRVLHDSGLNPAPGLARAAVEGNLGVLELTPERRSMEDIFIELTKQPPDLHGRETAT